MRKLKTICMAMNKDYEIFISYSHKDLDKVKEIKAIIEQSTGARCWMDLKGGIESGSPEITKDLTEGINNSVVFLFMYSKYSQESEYALKEMRYADKHCEHCVIIRIDRETFNDVFDFHYNLTDSIEWDNQAQREKLLCDIKRWTASRVASRRKAEEEARLKAEEVVRRKAEIEARRKAEEEAMHKAEIDAIRKSEEKNRIERKKLFCRFKNEISCFVYFILLLWLPIFSLLDFIGIFEFERVTYVILLVLWVVGFFCTFFLPSPKSKGCQKNSKGKNSDWIESHPDWAMAIGTLILLLSIFLFLIYMNDILEFIFPRSVLDWHI